MGTITAAYGLRSTDTQVVIDSLDGSSSEGSVKAANHCYYSVPTEYSNNGSVGAYETSAISAQCHSDGLWCYLRKPRPASRAAVARLQRFSALVSHQQRRIRTPLKAVRDHLLTQEETSSGSATSRTDSHTKGVCSCNTDASPASLGRRLWGMTCSTYRSRLTFGLAANVQPLFSSP